MKCPDDACNSVMFYETLAKDVFCCHECGQDFRRAMPDVYEEIDDKTATIDELKAILTERGINPDKVLANVRATLSFYLEPKEGAEDIILA